jgi:hypothetical protein
MTRNLFYIEVKTRQSATLLVIRESLENAMHAVSGDSCRPALPISQSLNTRALGLRNTAAVDVLLKAKSGNSSHTETVDPVV